MSTTPGPAADVPAVASFVRRRVVAEVACLRLPVDPMRADRLRERRRVIAHPVSAIHDTDRMV